jgi:hypothetical protein
VEAEFASKGKPGWFFVGSAREAAEPEGASRRSCLYVGPGKLIGADREESLEIFTALTEPPLLIELHEGPKSVAFFAGDTMEITSRGTTIIPVEPIDYQSDFEPSDGSLDAAYAISDYYYPRFRRRMGKGEDLWEPGGYGFAENLEVSVFSRGPSSLVGISPPLYAGSGTEFFAGRTVIFTGHHGIDRAPRARLSIHGRWEPGDEAFITYQGCTVRYVVRDEDRSPPVPVADLDSFARLRVAKGLQDAINEDPVARQLLVPIVRERALRLTSTTKGTVANGDEVTTASTSLDGSLTRRVELAGGGVDLDLATTTITHEFGHAFGYPHKCGYYTVDAPATRSCCMNYFHTWLYALGTHKDRDTRTVQRFDTGKDGKHFCARHIKGIRRGHLEDNPVLWNW